MLQCRSRACQSNSLAISENAGPIFYKITKVTLLFFWMLSHPSSHLLLMSSSSSSLSFVLLLSPFITRICARDEGIWLGLLYLEFDLDFGIQERKIVCCARVALRNPHQTSSFVWTHPTIIAVQTQQPRTLFATNLNPPSFPLTC